MDEKFKTAEVRVAFNVEEVLGREVESEDEKARFLAIASSFFGSEIIFEQFKRFVKDNIDIAPSSNG